MHHERVAKDRNAKARWVRGVSVMEPEDAAAAIAAGASWVVAWCGDHRAPCRLAVDERALRHAQAVAVGAGENDRQLRKGRTKQRWATIVIAEEWLDPDGNRLIFYREGPPADGTDPLPDLTSVGLA